MLPSATLHSVGTPEDGPYAAEYPARPYPCRRFEPTLADDFARLGAGMGR
jgi:hypothetical protein